MSTETKRVGEMFREVLVNRIKDGVENNSNVFLLSYSKLSGIQLNDFRKDLNKAGAQVHVSRNSIVKLALKEVEQEALAENIDGQTAIVWSNADSVEVSKVLVKFAKEFELLSVKGGLLDGNHLSEADVKKLSDLPSRDVLLGQLLGTIQAPVTRLMHALNAKSRDLLSILKQLSEKKGGE